jgi:hypothetical protein
MITWQKLVFDRECCSQAFRLLLTKIKSVKRSSSNSGNQSVRRPIVLAKRFTTPEEGGHGGEWDDEGDGFSEASFVRADSTALPRIPPSGAKSTAKTPSRTGPRRPTHSSFSSEWNNDTTIMDPPSSEQGRVDDERREDDGEVRSGIPFGSAEISIQRTTAVKPGVSAFAAKLKKSQLNSLQQENAVLANDNATLRNEISHLEALVATLQADNNQAAQAHDTELAHTAKTKILQAQNMQLQRQIGVLQDAMLEREMAESMLRTALAHWRDVIAAGRDDAHAAGADAQAKDKGGKPVQWMLAIPERLLDELCRVESQIDQAQKAMRSAQEAKFRVGGTAAEFLKSSSSTSIPFSTIYVPGIAHLRVERVRALEASLAKTLSALESIYDQIVTSLAPKMTTNGAASSDTFSLDHVLSALRKVAVEIGAFGIVVPSVEHSSSHHRKGPDDGRLVTVGQVLAFFTAASAQTSGVSAKDRDKQLKTMLKQLQASESASERERTQLSKEARYWRDAWAMQESLLRTLVQRVRAVGDKKMQWTERNLVGPLRELHDVWTSFQQTQQSQQDQRLHKNAYLPLLIDTLERHAPLLCLEAVDQWHEYAAKSAHEIVEILADYDANCGLLKSYFPTVELAS